MQIGSIKVKMLTWKTDRKTAASSIIFTVGPVLISETLDAEKSQLFIDMLHAHIQNIKNIELDLLADQAISANEYAA